MELINSSKAQAGTGRRDEIPCGEACPTPPKELGTGGKKRVAPLKRGQGCFPESHLESFSEPL